MAHFATLTARRLSEGATGLCLWGERTEKIPSERTKGRTPDLRKR